MTPHDLMNLITGAIIASISFSAGFILGTKTALPATLHRFNQVLGQALHGIPHTYQEQFLNQLQEGITQEKQPTSKQ